MVTPFEGICRSSAQNCGNKSTLVAFHYAVHHEKNMCHPIRMIIEKLRNLLVVLKGCFLRSVHTVQVFRIGENGTHSN